MAPTTVAVERLTEIDPREIWPSEERDFTPWLAKHLDELSHAVGMELQLVEQEGPVGDFRSDLVCRDVESKVVVVVENQLDASDHPHLGKLLTYAAGRGARAVIWISPEFRDEHSQAVEWLNSLSRADVSIFAVRLRVLKIGSSPPAISLDVVAGPSTWQKTDAESTLTPTEKLRKEFFGRFLERAPRPLIGRASKPPIANWLGLGSGKSSFWYELTLLSGNRLRASLMIETGDRDTTKRIFDRFLARRVDVERAFEGPLDWEKSPENLRSWVGTHNPVVLTDKSTWDPAIGWAIDVLQRLKSTFGPMIVAEKEA